MKPIFCGNFDFETRQSDLERLFSRYGQIERIDMKSGFAFVYFEDERDYDEAIHDLHDRPFGPNRRPLTVEWSRGDRSGPRPRIGSKSMANSRPTKTLFVIHFDPIQTRTGDIEKHFEPYGKVVDVKIRKNFAFVQFETQEEATKALECTNLSKVHGRVITVEYALRGDGEPYDNPRRGEYNDRRADSPHREQSAIPVHHRSRCGYDYGRAHCSIDYRYKGPSFHDRKWERDRGHDPPPYDRERERDRGHDPSFYYRDREKERDNGHDHGRYSRQ